MHLVARLFIVAAVAAGTVWVGLALRDVFEPIAVALRIPAR
jgi:hypothetical protein